jgi:hypothetical protein
MQELKPKKVYKSIAAIPVKVEMQPVEHHTDTVLTTEELQQQIDEARKGKAKVDNHYVGFELDERGHLFDYRLDYITFLSDMSHIIKQGKSRPRQKGQDKIDNPLTLRIGN